MANNYILYIGDGVHFAASSFLHIWGIVSKHSCSKWFLSKIKPGDLLWFVKSKTGGKIVAVATFTETKKRIIGPLIDLTLTNQELGWDKTYGEWDTEIHYKNLYNLTKFDLITGIKGATTIRKYNEKCRVNLPTEYPNIVRYLQVSNSI